MAIVLVVSLPRGNRRMPAVALRDSLGNAHGLLLIAFAGEAVVATRSEASERATGIHREHVGLRINQPFRRCGSRCAHHDPEASRAQNVDRAIQPGPVKSARVRLDPTPCEFPDTHP